MATSVRFQEAFRDWVCGGMHASLSPVDPWETDGEATLPLLFAVLAGSTDMMDADLCGCLHLPIGSTYGRAIEALTDMRSLARAG